MKESIEEAAERFRSNNPGTSGGGNNTKILNAFKAGARWQSERMYSEQLVDGNQNTFEEWRIAKGLSLPKPII